MLGILILALYSNATAQEEDSYSQTLKEMFKLSGSEEAYSSAVKQMIVMMKGQKAYNLDEATWTTIEDELLKTSISDLTEMLVPVYKKYLSEDDLKELIAFYKTPVGEKYAKSSPFITQEAMQVGQQWGMKIGQEIAKKITDQSNMDE